MRKLIVRIQDCLPGMKIAETIYNEYGASIISENTILDMHLIKKLENLGHDKIKIFSNDKNASISNDSEIFKAEYSEKISNIKEVLHDISVGKSICIETVKSISDSMVVRINENRDIVNCLKQIGSVDEYTYTHSVNVSMLSMLIGKWMKYDLRKIKHLTLAGLVHDIGKCKVPLEIINKASQLSMEEFEEIKKHSVYGYRLLQNMPEISNDVKMGVLMHHEREDGSGYPAGAKGQQIHEFAKIIAVADIYDAMTSNRPYKEKESPFDVFEIMENKSFGVLDPKVISVFLNNLAAYYLGDMVKLNNGEIGEIIYINSRHISQPIVKVGEKYIDLSIDTNIKIIELI